MQEFNSILRRVFPSMESRIFGEGAEAMKRSTRAVTTGSGTEPSSSTGYRRVIR
jgi:hypothetical protein